MTLPVSVSRFTWTAALVGVLNLLVGGALVTIARTRSTLKEIANEREATALKARGEDLEGMRTRNTDITLLLGDICRQTRESFRMSFV